MRIEVLTDMITPAVLLSACGSLILSTSNRLGRASDRVRRMGERARELIAAPAGDASARERALIDRLMPRLLRRVTLLHRTLIALYLAIELLILASLVIGASTLIGAAGAPIAATVGIGGFVALSYAAALLMLESRLLLAVNREEFADLQRELGAAQARS